MSSCNYNWLTCCVHTELLRVNQAGWNQLRECYKMPWPAIQLQEVPDSAPIGSLKAKLDLSFSGMEAKLSFSAQRCALVMGKAKERYCFYEQEIDMKWLGILLPPRTAPTPAHPRFPLSIQPGHKKTCCLWAQSNLHLPRSWLYILEQPIIGSGWAFHQVRSPWRA